MGVRKRKLEAARQRYEAALREAERLEARRKDIMDRMTPDDAERVRVVLRMSRDLGLAWWRAWMAEAELEGLEGGLQ